MKFGGRKVFRLKNQDTFVNSPTTKWSNMNNPEGSFVERETFRLKNQETFILSPTTKWSNMNNPE
jgi:hypothetical protein